jgi:hypothetical protein
MSLALINAGVDFIGRLKIKDGAHKGKTIEPGAKLLADQLARPDVFGRPNVFAPRDALARLSGKKGVILFWKINRIRWRTYRLDRGIHNGSGL